MGWLDKRYVEDRYKFDFLHYYKKDLDWMAFVTILFVVNLGLTLINHIIKPYFKTVEAHQDINHSPLENSMFIMLFNHALQLLFLSEFFNEERTINFKHKWVWVIHAISYAYITYIYYFTDAVYMEPSDARKMWVPLDIILTICITCY